MDIDEKLEELEDVIYTLDSLIDRITSEEIKNMIIDISLRCDKERQDLRNT